MQTLEITKLGNPILTKKGKKVEDIENKSIQVLIDQMVETLYSTNGVGLAAPQVGQSMQLFVMDTKPNNDKTEAKVVINPEITEKSQDLEADFDACLSVPGYVAITKRPKKIKVKYTDRDGQEVEEELESFEARVFQHEFDHLQGIVFLEHVDSMSDLYTAGEWDKRGRERLKKLQKKDN